MDVTWNLRVVLICIFKMMSGAGHLFIWFYFILFIWFIWFDFSSVFIFRGETSIQKASAYLRKNELFVWKPLQVGVGSIKSVLCGEHSLICVELGFRQVEDLPSHCSCLWGPCLHPQCEPEPDGAGSKPEWPGGPWGAAAVRGPQVSPVQAPDPSVSLALLTVIRVQVCNPCSYVWAHWGHAHSPLLLASSYLCCKDFSATEPLHKLFFFFLGCPSALLIPLSPWWQLFYLWGKTNTSSPCMASLTPK